MDKFIESLITVSKAKERFFKIGDTVTIAYYDPHAIDLWDTETNEAKLSIGFRRLLYLCSLDKPITEITEEELPTDINREFISKLCTCRYYKGDLYIPFPVTEVCRPPSSYDIEDLFSDFTITFNDEDYLILCSALVQHIDNILIIFEEYKGRLKDWEERYLYSYNQLIDIKQKALNIDG